MRKIISLILAVIMLVSAFAACGETTVPGESTENPSQEQTPSEPTASVPTLPDEEDEGDKDVIESETSGTAVQQPKPSAPVTELPEQKEQTQQPSSPKTPEKPETTAPSTPSTPSTPAKPVSTEKKPVRIGIWGDSIVNMHSMCDIVREFALADGFDVDFVSIIYNDYGIISTYNLYELYNWDGTEPTSQITSIKNSKLKRILTIPEEAVDFLIINSGRDRVLTVPATEGRALTVAKDMHDRLKAINPSGKLVLFVPPAYNPGKELLDKIGLKVANRQAHIDLINAYADRMAKTVNNDCSKIMLTDGFEFFLKNYQSADINLYNENGIFMSMAGAYYSAAVMYESLFGKSVCGSPAHGYFNKETATLLQNAAHKFVTGSDGTPVSHPGSIERAFSFEECNPRTMSYRDPKYSKEVYPAGYDELFASAYAYVARNAAVQYDKTALDQSIKHFWRRITNLAPEDAVAQKMLYLDCSGFCTSVYLDVFDYKIPAVDTSDMINIKDTSVFYWDGEAPDCDVETAKEKFIECLQPGDVIIQRISTGGHAMLYIGNGYLAHCTNTHEGGDSADYTYPAKADGRELLGGMKFDPITILTDDGLGYYSFTEKYKINVFRPLSLGLKPNQKAKTRLANLQGIIAYKETSAPFGITVNSGEDVSFAYVLRNDTKADKKITIEDTLPQGLTFKSGDVTFTNGKLSTSVTVPSGKTVKLSYVTTVTAQNGSEIACEGALIGGVPHNKITVSVAKTLTKDEQSKLVSALSSCNATDGMSMIKAVYPDIPFNSGISLGSDLFLTGTNKFTTVNTNSAAYKILVPGFVGGVNFEDKNLPGRVRELHADHLIVGDIIAVFKTASSADFYIYVGGEKLCGIANSKVKTFSSADSVSMLDEFLGEYAFCVLRPSIAK